jgi:hypothetical protein
MSNKDLEDIMVKNYTKIFQAILSSEFRADPNLKQDYYSSSIKEQHGIDSAIAVKAERLAKSLVGKLKLKGFLTNAPSDDELREIIKEVLREPDTENE